MIAPTRSLAILALLLLSPGCTSAAETYGASPSPITLYSQGTRMAGQLWRPKGELPSGSRRPAILLAHGWGGLRKHLDNTYGPKFAGAGFVVLAFDYRGWGESDGILLPVGEIPKTNGRGQLTLRAHVIREVIDPWDQLEDLRAALAFLSSEPDVAPDRIGIGGHAVFLAATESLQAAVVQVGAQGTDTSAAFAAHAQGRAREKARGELDPPLPQKIDQVPGLAGTPDVARMVSYRPIEMASRVRIPTLFIDVSNEELCDRRQHGLAAYELMRENTTATYKLLQEPHYDVYSRHLTEASDLAISWFREHLN